MTYLLYGTVAAPPPDDPQHPEGLEGIPARDDLFLFPDAHTLEAFLAPYPSMGGRIQETSQEVAHLDFGGSILTGEEPVEFEVGGDLPGNRRVSFYAHHHMNMITALNNALAEGESDEGLVEVRGWLHVLVLDRAAAEELRSAILDSPILSVLERDYLSRWSEAMNSLKGSGFVHFEPEKEPDA